MAMRKPHHKSKLGCVTCKKRRIKCGLERPTCENCRKRGFECGFRHISTVGLLTASSTILEEKSLSRVLVLSARSKELLDTPSASLPPPALLDTIYQTGQVWDVPDEQRLRFKQVLHHFVTTTSGTLSVGATGRSTWATALPQVAKSHPFVLDGIIAVTSLHLSRCLGFESERRINFNIANDRLSKGLIHYRTGLRHVTEGNAEALFIFSIVITAWTLLTIGEDNKALLESTNAKSGLSNWHQDNTSKLLFATIQMLSCIRGVLIIIIPYWYRLETGPLEPMLNRNWWPQRVPVSPKAIEEDLKLRELEKMWMRPEKSYEYYFDTLASSLKELRECFALVNELTVRNQRPGARKNEEILTDWSATLVWAVHLSPTFTKLLEQRIPEAWVLLAHFAMLPARVNEIVWLESFPSTMVSTAALILGEDKWHLIDWPLRAFGINLDGLRPVGSESSPPTSTVVVSTIAMANSL